MIGKHYGKTLSLEYLRDVCFIRKTGVSLAGISDGAQTVGFRTMAVRIPLQVLLNEAPKPLIAYWRQRHFVVVYASTAKHVLVADPAQGLVKYTHAEFLEGWTAQPNAPEVPGAALLLEPGQTFYDDPDEPQEGLRLSYFWGYLRPFRRYLVQIGIGVVLSALLTFIVPFLMQAVVDRGIEYQDIGFVNLLLIGQLTIFLCQLITNFVEQWILMHISSRINIRLISDFLTKLMRLPISFFETRNTGDILQRIDDHVIIERFLTSSSLTVVFSMFNMLVFGVVLALYNSAIFAVFAVSAVTYVAWTWAFMKSRKRINLRRFDRMSDNQGSLLEIVSGITEIKLQNIENQKRWKWEQVQARLFKIGVEDMRLMQIQQLGTFFIGQLKDIFITYLSAKLVIDGQITLGTMLSIQAIVGQVNSPLSRLLGFMRSAQDAKISLDRLSEVHKKDDEEPAQAGRTRHLGAWSGIAFQHLTFSYGGASTPPVLKDINLVLQRGKTTALVGASGSGKTTLMKLLLKFHVPTSGQILIGNQDLQAIHSGWWRSQCGVVMQEGFIFSDTLLQNIVTSDESPDEERLNYAIYAANLYDLIRNLPRGLATKIGSEGLGLSVGQKQRILMARAIYKNPMFLFFDEATSSLDANNEKIIMNNLAEFTRGRTVLVIAHRLSTVRNADRIVVLHQGEIVETGTHAELVDKQGYYYTLVHNQLELSN
ncbi:peptidase domain-containing ABC transporter [Spirosoma taeanense]|nr:peptidase domain-containing ABC transporter [Spirosoma taeanense]